MSRFAMTKASFQRGQKLDSATQKARSRGLSLGLDRSRVGGELLAEGELDDRLLPLASEEGQSTAKNQCREIEQVPHDAQDSARCTG